jgi:hypothetical protein
LLVDVWDDVPERLPGLIVGGRHLSAPTPTALPATPGWIEGWMLSRFRAFAVMWFTAAACACSQVETARITEVSPEEEIAARRLAEAEAADAMGMPGPDCTADADCPRGFGCFKFEMCFGDGSSSHCRRRCEFDFDCRPGNVCVCKERRRCSINEDYYLAAGYHLGFCRRRP